LSNATMARRAAARVRSLFAVLQENFGRRAAGLATALALEVLLLLLLLTLGQGIGGPQGTKATVTSFDVSSPEENATPEPESEHEMVRSAEMQNMPEPPEQAETPDPPVLQRFALIPLSRRDMDAANLANLPPAKAKAPAEPAYGPAFTGSSDDSEIVGSAPNGEPLYAARWYREPSDDELRGFLSTASGPGWALIACRTVPGWRVEDCVGLGEYPQGSQIQRAVLAAAWQFRVRPPKRGGNSLVGSWVRIKISYTDR